jgi:hypothetical protein
MLRLRCYVFANLIRDASSRDITREEMQFLESHRTECQACREREMASQCSLDAVRSIEDIEDEAEEAKRSKTGSILDNLGFNIQQS